MPNRKHLRIGAIGVFPVLVTLLSLPVTVSAGSTIVGTISYHGQPQEEEYATSKSPNKDYCATLVQLKPALFRKNGEVRVLPALQVRSDGALKDAIVAIQDIVDESFKDRYPGTEVRIEQCDFQPYTSVIVDKRNFHVVNFDPTDHAIAQTVTHNPHGMEISGTASRTLFNIGLAVKGSELNKTVSLKHMEQSSALLMVCDQHPYMRSWFLPVANSYYSTTGVDGAFEIKNVPPGRHILKAWHPKAGTVDIDVLVPETGFVRINIDIPVK